MRNQDFSTFNDSALLGDAQHSPSTVIWVTVTITAALVAMAEAMRHRKLPKKNNDGPSKRFTNENITARFIAAIPTITRELNLEVSTAHQTETFTQTSKRTVLWGWIDLGTNVAQVRVPVTYRYHVCLREPWELQAQGSNVIVHAPKLRASLPPAIHTDRVERLRVRGWCRGSARRLLAQLEQQITPVLSKHAGDQEHLEQVRHACRQSVAEFVRLWLEREGHWRKGGFTTIQVRFADEAALPPDPTLNLLE